MGGVRDGGKALILRSAGDDVFPNLQIQEIHEHANPRASEQGGDHPGRVHESATMPSGGIDRTDWHERSERAFLAALVKRLDEAVRLREMESVIIVAPPRIAGRRAR